MLLLNLQFWHSAEGVMHAGNESAVSVSSIFAPWLSSCSTGGSSVRAYSSMKQCPYLTIASVTQVSARTLTEETSCNEGPSMPEFTSICLDMYYLVDNCTLLSKLTYYYRSLGVCPTFCSLLSWTCWSATLDCISFLVSLIPLSRVIT